MDSRNQTERIELSEQLAYWTTGLLKKLSEKMIGLKAFPGKRYYSKKENREQQQTSDQRINCSYGMEL